MSTGVSEEHTAAAVCCLLHGCFFLGLLFDPEDGGNKQVGTKYNSACCQLHAGFLLGLFFDAEDGGGMLLRNIG
jgi:hypothetical protein